MVRSWKRKTIVFLVYILNSKSDAYAGVRVSLKDLINYGETLRHHLRKPAEVDTHNLYRSAASDGLTVLRKLSDTLAQLPQLYRT